jgi:mannosyltransferase
MPANLRDIDVVAPNFNTRFSGVTATILALVPIQAALVRIAAIGPGLPPDIPQVAWTDLLRHGWRPPEGRRFRVWHARRNVEMIAGLILARVLRQPWRLVFTSAAQRQHKAFTRFLIRRMDAVIATSRQAQGYLQVHSTVVMHGVDTQRYRPSADRAAEWSATGLRGRFGIGIFGRVRHQKGTDLFVEAMCRLLPQRADWTAVIIGLAKPEDRSFVDLLGARIAAAGLDGRIVFLGERPVGELPAWLRRISVAIAPARWEGFGLVPLEAMASGTPVVAAKVGAAADLVLDGLTGLLVPADNVEALARAAGSLMDMDAGQRIEMERAAREHVERNHSIENEARAIQSVYERLLQA